jgi:hypothetical protein
MSQKANRTTTWLAALLAVATVVCATAWLGLMGFNSLALEGSYSADSVFYIDAARNIAAGNGIVNSLARLDWAVAAGMPLPEPMTTWPPLYPVFLAAFEGVGIAAERAALIVPIMGAGATIIAAGLLAKALFGWQALFLTVAAMTQFTSLRFAAIHAWSETMALAFALIAVVLLIAAVRSEKPAAFAFAAGLASGCAFATRYALGPLIVPLFVLALWPHNRRNMTRTLMLASGFCLAALPVLLRNTILTGQMGGPEPAPGAGFLYHLAAALSVLKWAFVPEGQLPRIAYALIIVAALWGAILFLRKRGLPSAASALIVRERWFLWLWPMLYVFILVLSETRYVIEPINARLMLPATIVLLVGAVGVTARLLCKRTVVITLAGALLAAHAAWAEWERATPVLRSNLAPAYDISRDVANSATMSWLHEALEPGDLIIAVDSFDMALYLGPVYLLFLFSALPPESQPGYDAILAYLREHGTDYDRVFIVLRDRPLAETTDTGYRLLDDLNAGRIGTYPELSLTAELDDGSIYSLVP